MPLLPKLVLFGRTSLFVFSAYLLFFFGSRMFENLEITGDVYTVACVRATERCPHPHVQPLGWVGFGLVGLYLVIGKCFDRWLDRTVLAQKRSETLPPTLEEFPSDSPPSNLEAGRNLSPGRRGVDVGIELVSVERSEHLKADAQSQT